MIMINNVKTIYFLFKNILRTLISKILPKCLPVHIPNNNMMINKMYNYSDIMQKFIVPSENQDFFPYRT